MAEVLSIVFRSTRKHYFLLALYTLQDEAAQRARMRHKYEIAYTASHTINTTACVVSSVSSAGVIGTLAPGVGPSALPLGIGSTTQTILLRKLEKHDRIRALTGAKLNTVDRLVSKALKDDNVTDEEFDAIQREMSDFLSKKREIQLKIRASLNTEPDLGKLKKDLAEKGRQQGLLEAREALSGRT
jgi:hypothetical protein